MSLAGPGAFSPWLPHSSSGLLSFCQKKGQLLLGTCSPCIGTSQHLGTFPGAYLEDQAWVLFISLRAYHTTIHTGKPLQFIYIPLDFLGLKPPRMHRTHSIQVFTCCRCLLYSRCSISVHFMNDGSFGRVWYTQAMHIGFPYC